MWQALHSERFVSRSEAISYCSTLELSDHCDWRIPSLVEVLSLADPSQAERTPGPFEDGEDPTLAWAPDDAVWIAGSNLGYQLRSPAELEATPQAVRCVRPHQVMETSQERFVLAGPESARTASQAGTGLVWERPETVPRRGLVEAESYCQELIVDGGGFRLASIKELLTLVDPTLGGSPLIDVEVFPIEQTEVAWSSSSNLSAWMFDFGNGTAFNFGGQVTYTIESELLTFCVK